MWWLVPVVCLIVAFICGPEAHTRESGGVCLCALLGVTSWGRLVFLASCPVSGLADYDGVGVGAAVGVTVFVLLTKGAHSDLDDQFTDHTFVLREGQLPMMPLIDAIDLVIFDLDDTLFNHTYAMEQAIAQWAQVLGDTRAPEIVVKEWQRIELEVYPRYVSGELTLQGQRRERLRQYLPHFADAPDVVLDASFADFLDHYEAHWSENTGACATVHQLLQDGKQVAVLTSGARAQQAKKMHTLGINVADVPLYALEDVPVPKPDPTVFTFVCDQHRVRPDQALMVGDSLTADIDGALAAGLHAAWFTTHGTGAPPNAAQICDLRDVLEDF